MEAEEFNQSFNYSNNDIYTPLYSSPEVMKSGKDYKNHSEKSDVYSFGIIMYELITSKVPFKGLSHGKLLNAIVRGERPEIPNNIPSHYSELIKKCWDTDPEKRPTFHEIVNILRNDEFIQLDNRVDMERFRQYVKYVDHYKKSLTSQLIRPRSNADKIKSPNESGKEEVFKNPANIQIINLSDFDNMNFLGKGRFSQVFKIKKRNSNEFYAAKISIQTASKKLNQNILHEINIMMNLDHPSILKLVGYSPFDFENENKPTIVTEYSLNGSLKNVIDKPSNFPDWNETKRLIIIYGIVAGMAYLHKHSVVHNDLKPSNILLDNDFHPKIADFGLSQKIVINEMSNSNTNNTKGTPSYMAPEIWLDNAYDYASDVYAFGILLYELIYMKTAFQGLNNVSICYRGVNLNERPSIPFSFRSNVFKPLIQKCWDSDPKKRPTFDEILTELRDKKYITKNVDQNEYNQYVESMQRFK